MFKLVKPSIEYKKEAEEYIEEFKKYNSKISGTGRLDDFDNYEEWLQFLDEMEKSTDELKPARSTYFFVEENSKRIVGMANIRHKLNEVLINEYGSIGYSIRPTERRKGYGKLILKLALNECKKYGLEKVLLVCAFDNIGSEKVILSNGGVFENCKDTKCEGKNTKRFWIVL